MIFIMCFMALVLVGPIQYFVPALGHIQWAVTVLSACLLLRVIYAMATRTGQRDSGRIPGYMVFMGLFFVAAFLSTVGNMYLMDAMVDAKNYFQFWSIPLALFFLASKESLMLRLMKGLLMLAFINTPLSIVQYLSRSAFPGDAVTGTFGGAIYQPGPNAAMSAFQILQVGVVIGFALRRQLTWPKALALSLWYLIPVGLANAKFTLLFLPIMIALTLGRDVLRRPVLSASVAMLTVGLFSGLFYFHYRDAEKYGEGAGSVKEFVQNTVVYNIENPDSSRDDLTRVSAVTFWLKENAPGKSLSTFLFGHGIGASKNDGLYHGHLALIPKYREFSLSLVTLTRLLWDVGILGATIFTLIFVLAFFMASRLKDNPVFTPMEASFLASSQVACLFFILDIPYQNTHFTSQAFAAFVMLILGYIAFCQKKAHVSSRTLVADAAIRPPVNVEHGRC